jgi:transposase
MDTQPPLEICCGIDLHKDMLQACILAGSHAYKPQVLQQTFGTQYEDLTCLCTWLKQNNCVHVAMESTGTYWQPIFFTLYDAGVSCVVANPYQVKNLPNRKSDVNDAHWIALAFREGRINPSFVPNETIQTLRDYTRTYTTLIRERANNINRIEKFLQMHGFKLSSVISDITSKTGISILEHLTATGSISLKDVERLRDSHCSKDAQTIHRAIKGTLKPNARPLLRLWLDIISQQQQSIDRLYKMLQEVFEPYMACVNLLDSIPGIGQDAAMRIIGEIGTDMSFFP